MDTLTASDVALINRDNNGWGDNGFMWIFALLILSGMGGFGGWGNNRGNVATTEDLASGFNFSGLQSQNRDIMDRIADANLGITKGLCDLGYTTLTNFNNIGRQISDCCCQNEKIALENRYLAAQNTAEINATVTAGIQRILDAQAAEKAAAQAARIQNLELQQALCGVVRYPQAITYNAGGSPFCYNQQCCNY